MALIDYTSYEEIRATLGVDDEELSDDTLALPLYESYLKLELEDIGNGSAVDQFATIALVAEDARTKAQQRFFELVRVYSTYAVAVQLATSLPLFSPKDIGDGKASTGRFADGPYREVIKQNKDLYDRLRPKLEQALAAVDNTAAVLSERNFFVVSSPSTDPVVAS